MGHAKDIRQKKWAHARLAWPMGHVALVAEALGL
jgi:hypothetical protein